MNNLSGLLIVCLLFFAACNHAQQMQNKVENSSQEELAGAVSAQADFTKLEKPDADWKAELTEQEYYVLRQKGTERAFTGDLWNHKEEGVYTCAGCQLPLFASNTKFKSGTGWPSYYAPIKEANVATEEDHKFGWNRVEVLCARCDGHLGHVFEDGPKPTGLRYCINSVSLDFVPANEVKEE